MADTEAPEKEANNAEKAAGRPVTPKRDESDEYEGILIPETPLIAGESQGAASLSLQLLGPRNASAGP
jgi:hypothetical protein